MNTKQKGIIFTMIATILFGITPAVGKLTYAMGNNCLLYTSCQHLHLSKEDTDLAMLIALLHDIGRFEQWMQYQSFADHKTICLLYTSPSHL